LIAIDGIGCTILLLLVVSMLVWFYSFWDRVLVTLNIKMNV